MTTPIEALGRHRPPRPYMIHPPSHVTRAQAARILSRPYSTVADQTRPGGPLQAEDWYGTAMIPVHRVIAELAKQQGAKP